MDHEISSGCVMIIISLYRSCTQSHVQTGTNQNRIGTVNHPVVGLRKIVKLPRKYRHKNFLMKLFLGGPYFTANSTVIYDYWSVFCLTNDFVHILFFQNP